MIALPTFRGVLSGMDPDTVAFRAASGATDTVVIDQLVKYLKGENLFQYCRLFPFKSAQNAGIGTTVYGIGGLTSANGTMTNGPTWGANGITLDGIDDYVNYGDIVSGGNLTSMSRIAIANANPAATNIIASQDNTGVFRGWYIAVLFSGAIRILRSSNGTNVEAYDTAINTATTTDQTLVASWIEGAGRNLWTNKTQLSLTLGAGTNQTSLANSSVDVINGCNLASSVPNTLFDGLMVSQMFINGTTITTSQRETITDYINAL